MAGVGRGVGRMPDATCASLVSSRLTLGPQLRTGQSSIEDLRRILREISTGLMLMPLRALLSCPSEVCCQLRAKMSWALAGSNFLPSCVAVRLVLN